MAGKVKDFVDRRPWAIGFGVVIFSYALAGAILIVALNVHLPAPR